MYSQRRDIPASFRDHMDELLSRLTHEKIVSAGIPDAPGPEDKRPKDWSRCHAYHNQALFGRFDD